MAVTYFCLSLCPFKLPQRNWYDYVSQRTVSRKLVSVSLIICPSHNDVIRNIHINKCRMK
jgi:hypothetical protein